MQSECLMLLDNACVAEERSRIAVCTPICCARIITAFALTTLRLINWVLTP